MNSSQEEKPTDEFLLTFADLFQIIKKNKKRIQLGTFFFALLALYYGLTKPILYEASGTFKEKSKTQSGLTNSLSSTLFMLPGSESNAISIMHSKTLLKDLIKDQNLQGLLIKQERQFPLIPLKTIKNNLLLEYTLFKKIQNPVLNDYKSDFKLKEIAYNDEVARILEVNVLSPEKYTVKDGFDQSIDEGYFDKPFSKEDFSFTISHNKAPVIAEGKYLLILQPLEPLAEALSYQFKIESDKTDKSLLRIAFLHPDRKLAANSVNALMAIYQKHIQCEYENICEKQIGYLLQRQKEMANVLEKMIRSYASELASDLSSTGFSTSNRALEYLAATQSQLNNKLFTTNLDIQRLEKAKNEASINHDVFFGFSNMDLINKITTEKRLLKLQADSLNLALRNIPSQSQEFKESFASQLSSLDEIKQSIKESHLALASLNENQIPKTPSSLADESKYIFNAWHQRLLNAKENLDNDPSKSDCLNDWEECKKGFTSYLSNINHFLNVYQRNIEERLAHQQTPLKEFQGINLNMAGDLYVAYNKELITVESQKTQHEFILAQLNEPDFEISSLSALFHDSLSLDMITKASNIILALKDQENRSTKEQDRLNFDLAIQKGFLKTHIQQSIALHLLRENFLKEKIQHLQSLNLSLVQEKISILENEIKEFVSETLDNLKQEQQLIEKNLAELRIEMSAFPQKWATEELINQQMEINKSLVEEISKLIESKNIANNLEKLQSSPVDIAYPPIHPKSPRLLFLTIMGAVLGAFLSFVWVLGWSIIQGIQASTDNLKGIGTQCLWFLLKKIS